MRLLQQTDTVLLVDLSNMVARAVAIGEGNSLPLLCRMLAKQRRQYPHRRFVFAVEGSGTIKRQQHLPNYKGGRAPSPELNAARVAAIKMLNHVDCVLIKAPDGEADDAIACYCRQHPDAEITILSNDRDLWQLISQNVTVRATVKNTHTTVDRFACRRILGVDPKAIPLMKALLGDTSDSIPRGVPRVNKDKLARLAHEATTLENLPTVVRSASWLTAGDKTKIALAHNVVKQHLQVTRTWSDLDLKTRHGTADTKALRNFLVEHGVAIDTIDEDELRLIANGVCR